MLWRNKDVIAWKQQEKQTCKLVDGSLFSDISDDNIIVGWHDGQHQLQTLAHVSAFTATAAGRVETIAEASIIICTTITLLHINVDTRHMLVTSGGVVSWLLNTPCLVNLV